MIMNADYPLISCICITGGRIALLKKAINCFNNQDYPNKEMVVSFPLKDRLTRYVVQKIQKENVNVLPIERSDDEYLGTARNKAIETANGEYICIWDDDDWYHPSRLSYQYGCLKNADDRFIGCVFSRLLLFDSTLKKTYLSFYYVWEGTLMCQKEFFIKHHYTSKNRGEDSNVIDVLDSGKMLSHIADFPFLYIYVYHGSNTWSNAHFKSFFKRSEILDEDITENVLRLLGE